VRLALARVCDVLLADRVEPGGRLGRLPVQRLR
jgi:hypothetical protein